MVRITVAQMMPHKGCAREKLFMARRSGGTHNTQITQEAGGRSRRPLLVAKGTFGVNLSVSSFTCADLAGPRLDGGYQR